MWRVFLASLTILSSAGLPSPSKSELAVHISDPRSLNSVITFGSFPLSKGGKTRGVTWWRINVDLPRGRRPARLDVPNLAPPIVSLRNGGCFALRIDEDASALSHLKSARAERIACLKTFKDPTDQHINRAGMIFVGHTWDIDAYFDQKSRTTVLFQQSQKSGEPLVRTSMHVLALGGEGCPDCGSTTIRLFGYVGRQLTLAEIQFNVAFA